MDIWIQVSFLLILLKLLLMDNVMVKLQIKVKIESSLCSLRCPPPTGPGTRRSLWLWLRSRRPAARTIPSTGEELIGFDMISLIIEDVIGFDVFRLWFDIFKIWHIPPCRRCSSSSRTCVRKDLFCDGRINCALKTSKPPDETSCRRGSSSWSRWSRSIARSEFHAIKMNKTGLPSLTASPPESESAMWEGAGLPHFAGLFFGIIFLLVLLTYVAKNFQQKAPKTSTISELDRWLQKSFHWGKFYSFKTTLYLFKPKLDTFWVWFWNPPKSLDSPQCNK